MCVQLPFHIFAIITPLQLRMNNPFEYTPDEQCRKAFSELTRKLESLRESEFEEERQLFRELSDGKMLGILIATDVDGTRHTLHAFSGQLGDAGFHHPWFVPPVFDYLQPDGYFKIHEAAISRQNREIARFEATSLALAQRDFEQARQRLEAEVEECRQKCRRAKLERASRRESGLADEKELEEMIRQSQFEKAELHRLKKRVATRLAPYAGSLEESRLKLEAMKEKRRADSEALQSWLFTNFTLLNARGESRNLSDIFADTSLKIPPSGAGECCAPKLLQAAYRRGWMPVAIAEFWYGNPKQGEVRRHGEHYPACRGKCLPVLTWMLQGLEIEPPLCDDGAVETALQPQIIFENDWFCVVDKPSGMLSVPGKGNADSVQQWLARRYGDGRKVRMAHRLDRDTSGLIVATFGDEALKMIQSLFATRKVRKTYEAVLEGDFKALDIDERGRITLPLSPDWLDRPRQRVDLDTGKDAETDYEFTETTEGHSRVVFHPHTGRTHQLRVHSASDMGLGMPIAGDRLYGKDGGKGSPRLLLHARSIDFIFPLDGRRYHFDSPTPF